MINFIKAGNKNDSNDEEIPLMITDEARIIR